MEKPKFRYNRILHLFFRDINRKFDIKNLSYLPRWVILLLDVFIIIFSLVVTYYLLLGLSLNFNQSNQSFILLIFVLINTAFFWFFRTYSGIIRHSSLVDALKIFFSQISTAVVIAAINLLLLNFGYKKLCLNTGVLINFVMSFSLLFLYRIIIKYIFENYFFYSNSKNRVRTIIYGTDANATALANSLRFEVPGRFNLVGFFDRNNENYTKRILDLPIIKIRKSIPVMLKFLKVKTLIIADKSIELEEKNRLIEECISVGIKVYTVSIVSDYMQGEDLSKSVKEIDIHDLLERKPIVLDLDSISKELNNKVVLISGSAGSIGSEIVRQVIGFDPQKIILLDQAETPLHSLHLEILKTDIAASKIITCIADIKDFQVLESIFKEHQPTIIFHAAAYKHVPMMESNPCQAIFTNVMGTKYIADLAVQFKAEKFVMISTDKAVNPSSVMGASKRIAEMYVQSLQTKVSPSVTKFITTRFGNVLGSNGSVVPLFTKQIKEGGPITITHPDIIRYFMTIPEACQLVLEASVMANGGEIYLFDMGKPVRIMDLAIKMIRLAGYLPFKEIDIKIMGLRPGEKLYEELLNDSAKCLPTHHDKITIAIENSMEYEKLNLYILELISLAKDNKIDQFMLLVKLLLPDYKSLNSIF